MKNVKWRLLPLAWAAALAVSAAGAEGPLPESPESKKAYQLVVEVTGPVEMTITHEPEATDPEPVTDADRIPAQTVTLKEGPEYDVRLDGAGEGTVTYTVTLRDPSGEEEDQVLHRFEDIPVDENTVLKTVTSAGSQNTLISFTKDGEGKEEKLRADTAYGSGKNSVGFTVNSQTVILAGVLFLVLIAIPLLFRKKRNKVILQKPILRRKG